MKLHVLVFLAFVALGLCGCGESEVGIQIGPGLREKEVASTHSQVDGPNAISIYLISQGAVEGILLAKALNENGQEIGRSTTAVSLAKDDAKLVSFKFGAEVDATLVKSYLVDLKNEGN